MPLHRRDLITELYDEVTVQCVSSGQWFSMPQKQGTGTSLPLYYTYVIPHMIVYGYKSVSSKLVVCYPPFKQCCRSAFSLQVS